MRSSGTTVCHPWLAFPQLGYIRSRTLVIEPSEGGGGRRRRRRRAPHLGGHRPHSGTGGTPDGTQLHRLMGPTPRTIGATDRNRAANLADPISCHNGTIANTSFKQSRPLGLQDIAARVHVVTSCFTGSPTSPPHLAKDERPSHQT
jgi:hypothetical protein